MRGWALCGRDVRCDEGGGGGGAGKSVVAFGMGSGLGCRVLRL